MTSSISTMRLLCIAFLLFPFTLPAQWAQLGSAMNGGSSEDQLGYSVDMSDDGKAVVAGAWKKTGAFFAAGSVRVYDLQQGNWVQRGMDIDGFKDEEAFGWWVSISADGMVIAVGAPDNGPGFSAGGQARVYEWNGSAWVPKGMPFSGVNDRDELGYALDLSADGNAIAIGIPKADVMDSTNAGMVRVYDWNGSAWVQRGGDLTGSEEFDNFGNAVQISPDGNTLVVGVPQYDGNSAGLVQVYDWNGSAWVQRGMDLIGNGSNDRFGYSVSINDSGSVIAVGSENSNGSNPGSNFLRVFEWSGNAWVQRGTIANLTGGVSVSLDGAGDRVAVSNAYIFVSSVVKVFDWDGTNWNQNGPDLMAGGTPEFFGHSLDFTPSGDTLAVGIPWESDLSTRQGAVHVYTDMSVGIEESLFAQPIQVHPNPTAHAVQLTFSEPLPNCSITILNSIGQALSTRHFQDAQQVQLEIDAPAGIYFIQVRSPEGGVAAQKVLKK